MPPHWTLRCHHTYLRRLRSTRSSGRHSRCLWGPGEGLGACRVGSTREGRAREGRDLGLPPPPRLARPWGLFGLLRLMLPNDAGAQGLYEPRLLPSEPRLARSRAPAPRPASCRLPAWWLSSPPGCLTTLWPFWAPPLPPHAPRCWATYEDAAQLVQHPVAGGVEPLHVLLGTAHHVGPSCGERGRYGKAGGGARLQAGQPAQQHV
jgi:hypothetical protein